MITTDNTQTLHDAEVRIKELEEALAEANAKIKALESKREGALT